MKTKYEAIDSDGEAHRRTTTRTYTHCIVRIYPCDPKFGWGNSEQYRGSNKRVAWAGSASLAAKAAGTPAAGIRVEIIEAVAVNNTATERSPA